MLPLTSTNTQRVLFLSTFECERFARFPGGAHVTERPHEEQGTFGHPSGTKITSEAKIWPTASLFLRPAAISLKTTRQNASHGELSRLARASDPPSARANCTRGAGRGGSIVRHHGVVVQEAVGREVGHFGTQHSFGTYQRKIISFLAQELKNGLQVRTNTGPWSL